MNVDLKVLSYDPMASDPRVGPEEATTIDFENVAYIEYLDWSLESGINIFTRVTRDKFSGAKNPVIGVWLTKQADSAGFAAAAYPHNFLLITKNNYLQGYMTEYVHAQNWAFVAINRTVVASSSLSAYPFSFDDADVKYRGVGDGWVNLSLVSNVTAVTNSLQTLTIKNTRPGPLPSSEYRIYVEPLNKEYNVRATAFMNVVKDVVQFVGVIPLTVDAGYWPDLENADDRSFNWDTGFMDFHYVAYMYQLNGNIYRAQVGEKLPAGALPYLDCLTWDKLDLALPHRRTNTNRFFIPIGGINKLGDLLGYFYKKEMWHLHSESEDFYARDTDGTPMYTVGDVWIHKSTDVVINTNLDHNVDWRFTLIDALKQPINCFITDRDRASLGLLTYRYYLFGKYGPYYDWPIKPDQT